MTAKHALTRLAPLALAACLSGCHGLTRQSPPPTPPLVTDCLEQPQGVYPNEPARPKTLTDDYVKALVSWGNKVLGIATDDRIRWSKERGCVRDLQEAGQVR